jgi:hypothetical protein
MIEYTDVENATWKYCFSKLRVKYTERACREYLNNLELFERKIGFKAESIP